MKKYRFKIDTPWGKRGDEIHHLGKPVMGPMWFSPERYSALFEEVPELDPVEKVGKWLYETKYPNHGQHLYRGESMCTWEQLGPTQNEWLSISQKLLAAGLDPNKLEAPNE